MHWTCGKLSTPSLFTYLLKSRQCVDDSKKCTSLVSKAWTTCNTFNHSVMGLRDAWLTFSGTWGLQIDFGPYGTRHFLSPQNTWDERIWANAPALATKRGLYVQIIFTPNTSEGLPAMPPSIEEKGLRQIRHKSTVQHRAIRNQRFDICKFTSGQCWKTHSCCWGMHHNHAIQGNSATRTTAWKWNLRKSTVWP